MITLLHCSDSTIQFIEAKYDNNNIPIYVNPEDGTGGDAGNSFQDAMLVDKGTIPGTFEGGDEDDYYKFDATEGEAIRINLSSELFCDFDLLLYEPSFDQRSSSMRSDSNEFISFNIDVTGEWFIRVKRYSGYGNYTLILDLFETPQITTSEGSNDTSTNIWIIVVIIPLIFIVAIIFYMRRKKQQENEVETILYDHEDPDINELIKLEETKLEIDSDDNKEDIYRG